MRKLIIPFLLSALFATISAAQSATPEAVIDDFIKAWNSHEVEAFDRLFTGDAIWIPIAEVRVVGHAEVVSGFADIHKTWAKTTTIVAKDSKVQMIRPDVAVLLFHGRYLKDGKEDPELDRAMILVATKEGDGWKIATGQLTKQHEGR